MSSQPPQVPTARPARKAAPSVVASFTGDTSTGRWVASASACTKVGLSVMPPSTRSDGIVRPGVGLGRLDEVGAALGHALEHGPHDLRALAAAGEAEQRAAGAVVPARACRGRAGRARRRRRRWSSQRLATSWLSAAVAMMPRSSRSHSTLVPAESMTASTPQVVTPPRRQATIGKLPPSPWRSKRGRSLAEVRGRACRRCRR